MEAVQRWMARVRGFAMSLQKSGHEKLNTAEANSMGKVNDGTQPASMPATGTAADSAFDERMREIVVACRKTDRKVPKCLDVILMQFPKIDRAFRQVKEVFDSADTNHNHTISKTEMKACLEKLQVSVSDEEAGEIFDQADMNGSGELDFKEFILAIALLYLKERHSPNLPSQKLGGSHLGLPAVERAFEMTVDAFFFFDHDMDGVLQRDEVEDSFTQKQAGEGKLQHSTSARFREMDYDQSGQCTFKEFLFAFVGWVGTAEDEEEDEDAE